MVDPWVLTNDLVQTAAFFLLPPVLWFFLFWFAWADGSLARSAGFGRSTFWLLLPGCLVGSIADLPIFPWSGDILAVNIGGAAVPIGLAIVFLARRAPDPRRLLVQFLAGLAVESGILLAAVVALPSDALGYSVILVALTVPAAALLLVGLGVRTAGYGGSWDAGVLLAVTSGVLGCTFVFTAAVPGVGIVSQFPFYLLAPILAGVVAVTLGPRLGLGRAVDGLPIAYATSTLGVLLGADLLRQPPLYGSGSNVYSIGGAGLLDLVYLSGLLSALAGYVTLRALARRDPSLLPAPGPAPPATPLGRLRRALLLGLRGQADASLQEATAASVDAATQSRRLFGLTPPTSGDSAWDGLPVASWVAADQRNLLSLARRGPAAPQDAYRGYLTARWLVRVGRDLDRLRLASLGQRAAAFGIDLALVTTPAVAIWIVLVATFPGGLDRLTLSAPFNAAALGFSAFGLLYFLVGEWGFGGTFGKRWFGLEVRTRRLGKPGPIAVLVRELPKLIPLTVIGVAGITITALLVRGPGASTGGTPVGASFDVVFTLIAAALVIVLGVGVSGAVSAVAITSSGENQRLGDYLAGTWVVRGPIMGAPAGSPPARAAPSGEAAAVSSA